ncbi:hypothetical protein H7K33_11820 [Mycobacterium paraense]|uniref:Uncharacterized protein n=1 Tax=Mycobacterium paraense TaxID=767916 RepID=A0A1X2AHT1_9MYCO|nr:hypothetical protein [Mycobacterium paraense]MCV7442916.1 hypothetical protein [Mycobacterium paraense]ORW46089.1 hypothetical protein AWB89_13985 [Mycobacterium paraense]ORW50882.1 hypothetical protein AWB90_06430 [Mycobacterium paraense]
MLYLQPKPHSLSETPTRDVEPAASTHHHWPGAAIVKAIGHIHRGPSEPRRLYPLHEASYLETELMSRLMQRL